LISKKASFLLLKKMSSNDRYLNVQYGTLIAEVDITGISRLGGVKSAIKRELGEAIPVAGALIQLYTNSNRNQLITDLDDITPEKAPHYYQKLTQGGSCVVLGTSPPPSRQPTQTDLGSTFATASPSLLTFWTAFRNYSKPLEENTAVHFPENVFILGKESIGSSIYIRPCYPRLLEIALSIVEYVETRHLIILGNPGIGKTYFGYFLLLHLARSGATVIYETCLERGLMYLLSPNGVKEGSLQEFRPYLRSPTTFYIVDGMEPLHVDAKTILLTSLCKDIWHRFSKTSCALRYMPVWSREELHSCRSLLFPSLQEELVENLYLKWGGIARYVLKYARDPDQQALLNEALDISNIDSVVESFGGSGQKADASSRLIHRSVIDGFHGGPYQFASAYVVDQIYNRVYAKDRNHLIRFLSASQGIGNTGQLRGVLFEKYAHTVIAKGGSFKIRDLNTNEESTLHLPIGLSTSFFSNNPQVQDLATNCYFRPISETFESVDSFIKPNLLFQMTGAKNHPCKQTGLRDVLTILGNPSKPQLYFVVPPDRFASFKYQSYQGTDGKVLKQKGIVANVKKLSQFVLTFDLSSQ
jgi:hypothetical protein